MTSVLSQIARLNVIITGLELGSVAVVACQLHHDLKIDQLASIVNHYASYQQLSPLGIR